MRTVYLDSDFKCHVTNDSTMTAVETNAFDGKCDAYIEATRFVPYGETWVREDGAIFQGEMNTPWKDADERENAQRKYQRQLLKEYEEEIAELHENSIAIAELNESYQKGVDSAYD